MTRRQNEMSKERQISATINNTNNRRVIRITINRKQKWEEKMYGYFKRQTREISHEKTRTWLRKGDLKRETEYLQIAAQSKKRESAES